VLENFNEPVLENQSFNLKYYALTLFICILPNFILERNQTFGTVSIILTFSLLIDFKLKRKKMPSYRDYRFQKSNKIFV
jgi:hypothetical protein